MPTTWIEVTDTAVKIGLGALITAIGALLLAQQTHAKTLTRDAITRRTRILEEACAEAQEYFSWMTLLLNVIGSWVEDEPRNQTETEADFLTGLHSGQHHMSFAKALEARNRAMAKISLLGAHAALRHLEEYNNAQVEFRKIVARNERLPSTAEFEEFAKRFGDSKQGFFAEASALLEKVNR